MIEKAVEYFSIKVLNVTLWCTKKNSDLEFRTEYILLVVFAIQLKLLWTATADLILSSYLNKFHVSSTLDCYIKWTLLGVRSFIA